MTRHLHLMLNPDPTARRHPSLAPTPASMQLNALYERTELLEQCGVAMDSRIVDRLMTVNPLLLTNIVRDLAAEYGTTCA